MVMEVSTFEAKNRLSALLAEVERGVEVTITRARRAGGEAGAGRLLASIALRGRAKPLPACARRAVASRSAG